MPFPIRAPKFTGRTEARDILFVATAVMLAIAIFAGGASRENAVPAAAVQIAGACLLPFAIWRIVNQTSWSMGWAPLLLIAGILVPAIQLIPLPPEVWTKLPGRELALASLESAGLAPGWGQISLYPRATLLSGLALMPAVAMGLAVAAMSTVERRRIAFVVIVLATLSVLLGVVQVASGAASRAYLYETSHAGLMVGFFANRNHLADLLLCTIPLLCVTATDRMGGSPRRLLMIISGALLIALIASLGVIRSRAGIVLFLPTLIASLLLIWRVRPLDKRPLLIYGALAIVVVVVALVGVFAAPLIIDRFSQAISSDPRYAAADDIFKLGLAMLPFGTGLGTFDLVYRSAEPFDLLGPAFLNHAHNEYLEIFLETGVIGLTVLAVGLLGILKITVRAWLSAERSTRAQLARAGSIMLGVLVVHSLADYPLRTPALMTLFGLAVGFLTPVSAQHGEGRPHAHRPKVSEDARDGTRTRKRVRVSRQV